MTKVAGVSSKKKELLEKSDTLSVHGLIAASNPPQGLADKYLNVARLKLPSFPPPTATLSVDHRQADNPRLSLHGINWETKTKSNSAFARACSTRDLVTCSDTEIKKTFAKPTCTRN